MSSCLIQEAIEKLATAGLRITKQRKAMLEVLSAADNPMSAEETHKNLQRVVCDLVTIYRSLEQLERAGCCATRCSGKWQRYIASPTEMIITIIFPVDLVAVRSVSMYVWRSLKRLENLLVSELSHVMELFGLCPECSKKR